MCYAEFTSLPLVEIFQADRIVSHDVIRSTRTVRTPTSPSEKLREQVTSLRAAGIKLMLNSLNTILIVHLPLLGVRKDLICCGNLLKLQNNEEVKQLPYPGHLRGLDDS